MTVRFFQFVMRKRGRRLPVRLVRSTSARSGLCSKGKAVVQRAKLPATAGSLSKGLGVNLHWIEVFPIGFGQLAPVTKLNSESLRSDLLSDEFQILEIWFK
jgi:hypothetical protein